MPNFRVAVLQGSSAGLDCRGNLERGLAYCEEALRNRPDVILFPELWNIGYAIAKSRECQGNATLCNIP